jgi:uncharacterized membrane protein YhaH (DUF805 family)
MAIIHLFFGLKGRIGRLRFWVGVASLWALLVAVVWAVQACGLPASPDGVAGAVLPVLGYSIFALIAKRFNDLEDYRRATLLNWSYTVVLIPIVILFIIFSRGAINN